MKKEIANKSKIPVPKSRARSNEGKDERMPFKPAAISKNEPFQSDGALYGEDNKEFKKLLGNAVEVNII